MKKTELKAPVWLTVLFSVVGWVFAALATCGYFTLGLLFVAPVSLVFEWKKRRLLHAVAVWWARSIIAFNPAWQLEVRGAERVGKDRHYVVVANHQSLLDILVVLAGLPVPFKFMAKEELFWIPFLGWHMALAGYIPIRRHEATSRQMALLDAFHWLKRGMSVVFFPEGTRSPDGTIRTFKLGAFKAAQETGTPVLPVVINGTADAIPKHSWRIRTNTRFVLSIGDPVPVPQSGDLQAFQSQLREHMIQRLEEMRSAQASASRGARL